MILRFTLTYKSDVVGSTSLTVSDICKYHKVPGFDNYYIEYAPVYKSSEARYYLFLNVENYIKYDSDKQLGTLHNIIINESLKSNEYKRFVRKYKLSKVLI